MCPFGALHVNCWSKAVGILVVFIRVDLRTPTVQQNIIHKRPLRPSVSSQTNSVGVWVCWEHDPTQLQGILQLKVPKYISAVGGDQNRAKMRVKEWRRSVTIINLLHSCSRLYGLPYSQVCQDLNTRVFPATVLYKRKEVKTDVFSMYFGSYSIKKWERVASELFYSKKWCFCPDSSWLSLFLTYRVQLVSWLLLLFF